MGDTRERAGAAGVAVAGVAFKIALYVCVVVLLFWIGKASYQFGHDVFNQQAMSPGRRPGGNRCDQRRMPLLYKIGQNPSEKRTDQRAQPVFVCPGKTFHLPWTNCKAWNLSFKHCLYTKPVLWRILAGDDERGRGRSDSVIVEERMKYLYQFS